MAEEESIYSLIPPVEEAKPKPPMFRSTFSQQLFEAGGKWPEKKAKAARPEHRMLYFFYIALSCVFFLYSIPCALVPFFIRCDYRSPIVSLFICSDVLASFFFFCCF